MALATKLILAISFINRDKRKSEPTVITLFRRSFNLPRNFSQTTTFYKRSLINNRVHHSVDSRTKRLIDITGALVGLTLTAILLIPLAIAMQLDNPGPVFYTQIRCGLKGKVFRLWKFRSMVVGAEKQQYLVKNQAKGHIFKNANDPRVTRIGRFLRRTSLDEFPQFWNVLRGEMSLVGTRPPTPNEVTKYELRHWQRLKVKPGMTGEWQVKGRSTVTNFEDIFDLDLNYQKKWSVFYDIHLIICTIAVIFTCRGAC